MFQWAANPVAMKQGWAAVTLVATATAGVLTGRWTKDGPTYFGKKYQAWKIDRAREDELHDDKVIERVIARLASQGRVVSATSGAPIYPPAAGTL